MRLAQRCLLALLLAAPTLASAEAATAVSGQRTFVIAECDNASIVLRFTADTAPLAVRTKDIRSKGPAAAAAAWSIAWTKPVSSDQSIGEYQATGTLTNGCPDPGSYEVPLAVSFEGTPPSAAGIAIAIVRAGTPVLDAPASVTLALETLPFGFHAATDALSIPLHETSHVADLKEIAVTGSALKAASGEYAGIVLDPLSTPLAIAAGGRAELKLALSQVPAAGSYTGTLILHEAMLKENRSINVTLKVRVAGYFLMVAVALGIALGWFFNVRLAKRAALSAALLEGLRAVGAIAKRAAPQKDPAVQQRLIGLAAAVEASIRDATTPEAMQAAVTDAQTRATAIETRAVDAAKEFAQSLARVRGVVAPNHLPPDAAIAHRLTVLTAMLDRIDRLGSGGDVEEAQRRLAAFEQTLPRDVPEALQPWLREVGGALDALGPWANPAREPEQTRRALADALRTAFPLADPGQLVQQADDVARRLRGWVALSAPPAMAEQFRAAAAALRPAQVNYARLIEALSAAADNSMRGGADEPDPIARLQALAAIRRGVEAEFRIADPANGALDAVLAAGDFPAAVAALLQPGAAVAAAAHAALQLAPLQRAVTDLGAPGAAQVPPRLDLPPDLMVNRRARARLDWANGAPPGAAPQWSCDPQGAAVIADGEATGANVTPRRPGFLTVSVQFGNDAPISAGAYAGEVTATPDYAAIAAAAGRVNLWIGIASALLTTFAGYEIFIGTWLGTFGDFFSAFLWGFFGQFGLDRVRDLAKPITGRALP